MHDAYYRTIVNRNDHQHGSGNNHNMFANIVLHRISLQHYHHQLVGALRCNDIGICYLLTNHSNLIDDYLEMTHSGEVRDTRICCNSCAMRCAHRRIRRRFGCICCCCCCCNIAVRCNRARDNSHAVSTSESEQ